MDKTSMHNYTCFTTGLNTFDSPTAVAAAMAGSLAGVMDVLTSDSKRKGGYKQTCYTNAQNKKHKRSSK